MASLHPSVPSFYLPCAYVASTWAVLIIHIHHVELVHFGFQKFYLKQVPNSPPFLFQLRSFHCNSFFFFSSFFFLLQRHTHLFLFLHVFVFFFFFFPKNDVVSLSVAGLIYRSRPKLLLLVWVDFFIFSFFLFSLFSSFLH